MSGVPTTRSELDGKGNRDRSAADPVAGLNTREYPTEESAALAETFLARLGEAEGFHVPRVRRREGRRLVVESLPGKALTSPDRDIMLTVANLQARIHVLDWPGYESREACAENYRRFFRERLATYEHLGLVSDSLRKRLVRRFETAIPWRMHPAVIHDDLWGGSVLYHEGDIYLADYASVKFLALESDLLNSARYFRTQFERLTGGLYSLRTRYVRAYCDHGARMCEVVQEIDANRPFFVAFNALRKGCDVLLRLHAEGEDRGEGLAFAMRRLRHIRSALKV